MALCASINSTFIEQKIGIQLDPHNSNLCCSTVKSLPTVFHWIKTVSSSLPDNVHSQLSVLRCPFDKSLELSLFNLLFYDILLSKLL